MRLQHELQHAPVESRQLDRLDVHVRVGLVSDDDALDLVSSFAQAPGFDLDGVTLAIVTGLISLCVNLHLQ